MPHRYNYNPKKLERLTKFLNITDKIIAYAKVIGIIISIICLPAIIIAFQDVFYLLGLIGVVALLLFSCSMFIGGIFRR